MTSYDTESFRDFAAAYKSADLLTYLPLPAIHRVSGIDFVFQQDSALAHRTAHMQQLNCYVKKRHTFLHPTCGLQTAKISVLWITRSELSCSIVSTADKFIVWMN